MKTRKEIQDEFLGRFTESTGNGFKFKHPTKTPSEIIDWIMEFHPSPKEMAKEEFEEIIKPLFLIDNKTHRDFLTQSIIRNFNRWNEKKQVNTPKEISEEEIKKVWDKHFISKIPKERILGYAGKPDSFIITCTRKQFIDAVLSLSLPSSGSKTEAVEFAEWIRLRFQNAPLEFDNYWEDYKGFPNNTGKCYTTSELFELFLKDKQQC